MNVEVSQIPTIASEFITTVVMPKAPTGLLKFGIGFVSPYIRDAVAVRVEQSQPTLKMLGIVDEGKVDLDRASAAAYAAGEFGSIIETLERGGLGGAVPPVLRRLVKTLNERIEAHAEEELAKRGLTVEKEKDHE